MKLKSLFIGIANPFGNIEFCTMRMKRYFKVLIMLFLLPASAMGNIQPLDTIKGVELPSFNIVAIKQPGNLNNEALSSTVVNIGEIQINDITDIKTLSDIVPNFYIPPYGSRITSSIYVRGIGARMDQPSVGLTIDNLPVLNKDAYDLDIPDLSEIEMLGGPQSSLYGRNTMCGLINLRTLSPMNFQGFRFLGEFISTLSYRLQGGWYHKFNDNTAFSANISFNDLRGEHKNIYNDKSVGDERSGSTRLKFEWYPTADFSLLNTFSGSLLRQSGYAYESALSHEINYNDTCFYKRTLINDVVTLNYKFPKVKLSGIISLQHINDNMTLDQDFLPLSYFTLTQMKQETDFTGEIIAQRNGSHQYHWMGGLFVFYRDLNMQAPVTFKQDGISNLIEHYRNQANPHYPIQWNSDQFLLDSDFKIPSTGIAVYHESRFNWKNWKFTAALRMDYEHITLHYRSNTNTSYTIYENPSGNLDTPFSDLTPYRNATINIDDEGKLSMHFLTLLPKVSALYELPSSMGNIYFAFGKGYKAGGYNTQMFSDVLQQRLMSMMGVGAKYDIDKIVKYKPEYSFNYELGAHFDLRQLSQSQFARLKFALSLFYIDCRDQQLTVFPDGNTTGRIMTNAGKTRSFGGEISAVWKPYDSIDLNASYGYTNARFIKFFDGRENYAGKRLPYAPQNTLFIQLLYTIQPIVFGDKKLIFDLNLRSTGNIYWNESNTLSQPFYSMLGASAALKASKWEIQLWGRNLTNTKYDTFYFMSIGNEFLQRGNKINGGITVRIFL